MARQSSLTMRKVGFVRPMGNGTTVGGHLELSGGNSSVLNSQVVTLSSELTARLHWVCCKDKSSGFPGTIALFRN